jgi:putative transcription factor
MSYCELCGKPAVEKKMVVVDGTVFKVCMACSKHGKPYVPPQVSTATKKKKGVPTPGAQPKKIRIGMSDDLVLDPEFPRLIREARMKKGLTHEQLGMQMNEKANLLRRFETGALKPDEIFAKKLERHLGIKLYVNASITTAQDRE